MLKKIKGLIFLSKTTILDWAILLFWKKHFALSFSRTSRVLDGSYELKRFNATFLCVGGLSEKSNKKCDTYGILRLFQENKAIKGLSFFTKYLHLHKFLAGDSLLRRAVVALLSTYVVR